MEPVLRTLIPQFPLPQVTKPISTVNATMTTESASTATLDTTLTWMLCALNFLKTVQQLITLEIAPVVWLDSSFRMELVCLRNATWVFAPNSTLIKHNAWNVLTALICRTDVAGKWMVTAKRGSPKLEFVSLATLVTKSTRTITWNAF